MSTASEVEAGGAIDSIILPPDVVDGLIASALLRLNDGALVSRFNSERLFAERVDRMAQHIAIALVCAQVFEKDDDFIQALAHKPFAQGDGQALEVGGVIVDLAQIQFAELDIGVGSASIAVRVGQIRAAL